MISIREKIEKVGRALRAQLGEDIVFHYWRAVKAGPMCIWAEDGEGASFRADRMEREQAITGSVDYFTEEEYDANVDKIQDALNSVCSNWSMNSVQYEEETDLIHYEWVFTVI